MQALAPNGDWDGALTMLDGKPVIMFDCFDVADCRPPATAASNTTTAPPSSGVGGVGGVGAGGAQGWGAGHRRGREGRVRSGDPAIVGVARPVDYNDPNLTKWEKDPNNPIAIKGVRTSYAGPSEIWKVGLVAANRLSTIPFI